MCGINGILRLAEDAAPVDSGEIRLTRDAMASRGPDGVGEWVSPSGEIGLGHRRLAIIDLTEAGRQPMRTSDGRYHIVFNGEIYNYRELRDRLAAAGVSFHSRSDTEVILALYAREGTGVLSRLRGMYAFAIWDEAERTLLLARDPYGIKPLYLAQDGAYLRFASQVKALEAGGGVPGGWEPAGLVGFLLWGSVPEPFTIRKGIRALPAGHFLRVERGRVGTPQAHHRFGHAFHPPVASVEEALEASVEAHLVADVPVAVFLSAGMDSTVIAVLARRRMAERPTTLTLRFDEFAGTPLDEAPLAAEVARALGTRHIERRVRREDFLDLWPQAVAAMDQPSIDGFNTYVVSRMAHEAGFKVVLSGLGGDELFGSYPSFRDVPTWCRRARRMRRIPGVPTLWPPVARLFRRRPKLVGLIEYGRSLPGSYFLRRGLFLPSELRRLLGAAVVEEGLAAYDPLADAGKYLEALCRPAPNGGRPGDRQEWESVHVMESTQYMRNQLLRDSDWASMAHSLELRVPLVDPWLREQAASFDYEPARSRGKSHLARKLAPELPEALWSRPKSGFSIPVMEWLEANIGVGSARGPVSRRLALRILEAFGVGVGR
jgi:asparagine synthase (glutamine-hydrolysing)